MGEIRGAYDFIRRLSFVRRLAQIVPSGRALVLFPDEFYAPMLQMNYHCWGLVNNPIAEASRLPAYILNWYSEGAELSYRHMDVVFAPEYYAELTVPASKVVVFLEKSDCDAEVLTRTGGERTVQVLTNFVLFLLNKPLWGGKEIWVQRVSSAENQASVSRVRQRGVRGRGILAQGQDSAARKGDPVQAR